MNHTELVMRRKNIGAFIDADPISLVLTREGTSTKTEAGGYVRTAPTTLQSQVARIVPNRRRYTAGIVNSEAGDIPHTDYLLLGRHTLNVRVDDTFTWMGDNYQVTGIHGARIESVLASIDLLGPDNRG